MVKSCKKQALKLSRDQITIDIQDRKLILAFSKINKFNICIEIVDKLNIYKQFLIFIWIKTFYLLIFKLF